MFGKGLLQGLGITFKRMVGPNITEFYPEEKPNLPIRVRSSMGLEKDKCISCNMCAMACPNSVIKLTSEKNEANKKVLKTYHMDVGRCLFCGMCAEVCPTKALKVTQDFENAIYEPDDMQWDMIQRAERKGKVE
ncbi:NADH-quinone oxidoreductase subunit I [Desulfosporosinus sp. BICA1-9]|uniref:NuoI/complex I 23 kDa subunit family protein n=1 Tax=Desulfosporosinus sp. BICA1-9 TaxID=1531958 RepID=UPI00054C6A27|nr:NADH-quinone oxidoreductase subunit I [Desulfosporosinus sp. BICA1-9]KJS85704.1 MAG: NADH-quinone oxidoreductase subunit I [Desulfosporosinus sp. BICA1-9]KJS90531.1 MAG: NADH-quinone oxidoreductase subunit I [Desulfosporosinus sp. BICA1-9]HBW36985.1 NADH-quinone oxidoreductase subunit I [Desulfosporosinus sp.]